MTRDELLKALETSVAAHGVPAASIAVYAGGETLEAATGVLNVETGVEATVDALHQVGSTTKVWTSVLIMQLVDEGLLDLDQPVRAYLPEFVLGDEEAAARVTVRHLLTHTGGFDGDIFTDTGRGDDSVDLYVKSLGDLKQIDPPGTAFSYCNSGYVVLGAIVARLRGCTWEEAMRKYLATPLGCTHIGLLPEETVLFRAAAGHGRTPEGNKVLRPWLAPRSNAPAGSTLCLAPRELVRFGRMLMAGGVAEDGTRVLSEESVRAMLTPNVDVPPLPGLDAQWGLGIGLLGWGGGAYGHDGGTTGNATTWWIAPETGVVMALAVNSEDAGKVFADMRDLIAGIAKLTPPARLVPPADPQSVDTAPYVGGFESPAMRYDIVGDGGALKVTLTPGELAAKLGMEPSTSRYVHVHDHVFLDVESDRPVVFTVVDGKATHLFNSRSLPRVS
ncbi:serine hydrolase domain-containing protein [Sinosporangium siamense]|uniref:Serine hydrolase n=1 Tax=Sinosporangium siamense TaxID=1367973 RepID=A0A919VB14_9ACTN|nr:serine hydrolase domain-containing protein [Sinosporangium siamense]GII96002.1 serine hydrolase [Sinosporangium siamense]